MSAARIEELEGQLQKLELDVQTRDEMIRSLVEVLNNVEQRCAESAILDLKLLGELVRTQRERLEAAYAAK